MAMRAKHLKRDHRQIVAIFWMVLIGWSTGISLGGAETYTYVDDNGTVVFTDKREVIPEKYRARAKVMEGTAEPSKTMEAVKAAKKLDQLVGAITDDKKGFSIGGLTPYQSRVLVMGFVGGILMLSVMVFTGNSALKMLMRWLLVLLAIGTSASIYFSSEALTDKAKNKGREVERAQREQVERIERMDPANETSR
jgi:uncharacterized protein DUF4124